MSKSRVKIEETPLDPFAFEKSISAVQKNNPYQTPSNGLEFVTEVPIEEGYSSLGNSRYAQQALQQHKAESQSSLDLISKGVGRTISKVGSEILKTPGYVGGAIGAIGNEVFGDGKNSMSLMVDNAWVNAFESMDEKFKELMPVHIQQEVQDGNILDKMGSGAWWATQGADGVGFMLSMFVPGAVAKLAGSGKALAGLAEVIANTKLGKITAAPKLLGLSPEVAELAGQTRAGQAWINGADGIVAATVNTGLEAAAEAAGTYDNTYRQLKEKVKSGEMSDERAKELAGEKASSVFKSNIGLLMVSNLLEQAWVWKAFGSNADSVITKAFKDGKLDLNALKSMGSKSFAQNLKEYSGGVLKNAAKEGVFEEGIQSQIEQNIEQGKSGAAQAAYDLVGNILSGKDEFWENTEMHEAMVLGSVLGSGMGFIGQVKENNNLDRFLNGYNKAQVEDKWYNKLLIKAKVKQDRPDSTGIIKLLDDNFIKNFKSDLSSLQTDGKLDPNKMFQAWEQGKKEEYVHAMYDAAVATGDEIGRQKWGLLMAQNYTQPFLGQQGMERVFEDHVKNELTEVWKDRFEKQNQREVSKEELDQFQSDFIQSGKSVFDAYNEATRTNYPERFVKPELGTTNQYAKFRQQYMNLKLQTLLEFESLKTVETKANEEFRKQGLESKIERLEDFNYKINGSITAQEGKQIQDYFKLLKELNKKKVEVNQNYELLFDRKAVQELYQSIINDKTDVEEELAKDTTKKKEKVKDVVETVAKKEEEIIAASLPRDDGFVPIESVTDTFESDPTDKVFFEIGFDKTWTFDDVSRYTATLINRNVDRYLNKLNSPESQQSFTRDELDAGKKYLTRIAKDFVFLNRMSEVPQPEVRKTLDMVFRYLNEIHITDDLMVQPTPPISNVVLPEEVVELPTPKRKKVPVKKKSGEKKELTVVDSTEGTRIGELTDEGFVELKAEDFLDFQIIDEVAQEAVKDIDMSDFQMIEGTQVDLTSSSNLPIEEPTTETESLVRQEIGRLPIDDKHTSGLHIAYTFDQRYIDNLTPDGLPVLGTESQQRWFNTVNNLNLSEAYTVVVYPYSEIRKDEQLFLQISRETSGIEIKENDLWSVLYKNGKPVMDNVNFVFTSIQRPETVYQGSNLRVANRYIDEFPGNTFAEKKDNAEQYYRQWYNSFTSPTELSITDRSKGHMLMRRDSNGDPIWNKASTNIPEAVNRLEVSETGEIVVGGNVFKIQKGDVVAISDSDNVYPLRNRDLNNQEVDVIISMLDMLNTQSISDVQLNVNIPITDVKSRSSIGVFTDTDVPLFNYFTRFSKGEGGFYLEGNQIIYHPYGQEERSILLSELRSDKGKDFRDFLLSKRKVYNKRISQRPAFTLTIKDGSIKSVPIGMKFQDHAMSNDLLTLSVVAKGYPSRLQQNLYLGDRTGRIVNAEQSKIEVPTKPVNKYANRASKASKNLEADKVFTADEILQIKLQSGEITKICK